MNIDNNYSIQVEAFDKNVILFMEHEGIRIQGDSISFKKRVRASRNWVCIPISDDNIEVDSTNVFIPNRQILQIFYNDTTNMIQIHALVSTQSNHPDSNLTLFRLMYTVLNNEKEKAIEFCETMLKNAYGGIAPEKRLKVLVNPFGGQGKAKTIFEEKVQPIFEAAKCDVDVQYTEYYKHALEIAKELDIEAYDAIVTVSGDGLAHEVINGFLERPDGQRAIKKVPLGFIPAGTSNSVSISLSGEKLGFDPVHCALQVIKGRPLALDICSVTYDDRRYFSFLSQNFGIAAYADLGTEHMRWMGDARVTVGLLQEIFSKKTYRVEGSLLLEESNKEKIKENYRKQFKQAQFIEPQEGSIVDTIPPLGQPVPENWTKIDGDISFFLTSNFPLLNRGMLSHPCAMPNDGCLDLLLVGGGKGFAKQLSVFTNVENGKHINLDVASYYKVKAFRLKPILKPGKTAYLAIDGEHAPVKEFQVEVHQSLGSVLCFNPSFIDTHI